MTLEETRLASSPLPALLSAEADFDIDVELPADFEPTWAEEGDVVELSAALA